MGKRERPTITLADPTRERLAKEDAAEPDIGTGDGRITLVPPIERYWRRELITGQQYAVALEYRACVFRGLGGLASPADLCRIGGGTINWDHLAKSEAQADARQVHARAVKEMGPVLTVVVDGVVILDKTLDAVGADLGLSHREGISVSKYLLGMGLDALSGVFKQKRA